jgi:membrane protein required for colicin V production
MIFCLFFSHSSPLYFLYSFIFALFSLFFNYEFFLDIVLGAFLYALFTGMKNGLFIELASLISLILESILQ